MRIPRFPLSLVCDFTCGWMLMVPIKMYQVYERFQSLKEWNRRNSYYTTTNLYRIRLSRKFDVITFDESLSFAITK